MIEVDTRDFTRAARVFKDSGPVLRQGQREARRQAFTGTERDLRASARSRLPRRGGLAAAAARLVARRSEASDTTTLTVSHPQGLRIAALDRGDLRHPTYGRRPVVRQRVRSGFAQAVFRGVAKDLERGSSTAFADSVRTIARKASS